MRSAICRWTRSSGTSCDRLIRFPVSAQIMPLSAIDRGQSRESAESLRPGRHSRENYKVQTTSRLCGSPTFGGRLQSPLGLVPGLVTDLADLDQRLPIRLARHHLAFMAGRALGHPIFIGRKGRQAEKRKRGKGYDAATEHDRPPWLQGHFLASKDHAGTASLTGLGRQLYRLARFDRLARQRSAY